MTRKSIGKITIIGGANVWPHEMLSAKVLIHAGYSVEFIPESKRRGEKKADCYLDGELWEMKAPNGATLDVVERNLRRAAKKANNVIFDSRRVKKIPDVAIARELSTQLKCIKKINKIKFINRQSEVLDMK
ncbi:MAG: hypothetical protein LBK50_03865 [Candidatus Nomurabacteria bacterium]|jgi:hypothetical protein|nr:hypothetical protein [Candidatus Nomurabacteria bacterium]